MSIMMGIEASSLLEEICVALNLNDEEQIEAMRRRLRAMERDGQVARNRRGGYGTLDKLNLIKGRVIGHPEGWEPTLSGHGFWICECTHNLGVYSGNLHAGSLFSRATDFGSGSAHTIWESSLGVYSLGPRI